MLPWLLLVITFSHCLSSGLWVLNTFLLFHLWQFTSGERRRLRPGLSISVFVSIRISSSDMTSGALSSCISNGETSRYFHERLIKSSHLHCHGHLCWLCLDMVCVLSVLGGFRQSNRVFYTGGLADSLSTDLLKFITQVVDQVCNSPLCPRIFFNFWMLFLDCSHFS